MKALILALGMMVAALGGRASAADGLLAQPVIGGMPMRCYDFRGKLVQTFFTDDLGDVGRASIIARIPVIELNSARLGRLPPKMQIFFFMHECAHHVLGHIMRPTLESERDADCWSINYGRWAGFFSRKDIEAFAPILIKSNGSRFGHLPGLERQANLLTCFDDPKSEPGLDASAQQRQYLSRGAR